MDTTTMRPRLEDGISGSNEKEEERERGKEQVEMRGEVD